jgi:TPR repeat protein
MMCLLTAGDLQRDMRAALPYFIQSAESGNPDSQIIRARALSTSVDATKTIGEFRSISLSQPSSGDADGVNSFSCCRERGEGVDANTELAVKYYRKAASQSHLPRLYNIGRCSEYGLGIERDLLRAGKHYRMAAELGNPSAQNNFRVFLQKGNVFRSNQILAAHYCELSALQGGPDGAQPSGW